MATSASDATSELTSQDLEALVNIQAELDRIGLSAHHADTNPEADAPATASETLQEPCLAEPEVEPVVEVSTTSSSTFKVVNSEVCAILDDVVVESHTSPVTTPVPTPEPVMVVEAIPAVGEEIIAEAVAEEQVETEFLMDAIPEAPVASEEPTSILPDIPVSTVVKVLVTRSQESVVSTTPEALFKAISTTAPTSTVVPVTVALKPSVAAAAASTVVAAKPIVATAVGTGTSVTVSPAKVGMPIPVVTTTVSTAPKVIKPLYIIPNRTGGMSVAALTPKTTQSVGVESAINKIIFTSAGPGATISGAGASKPIFVSKSVLEAAKALPAAVKGQFATAGVTSAGGSGQIITKVIITSNAGLTGHSTSQTVSIAPGTPLAAAMASAGITGLSGQPVKIVTAAQAQAQGLLTPGKTLVQTSMGSPIKQQVLSTIPSSPQKQTIMVSKIALSPKTPTKITMIPVSMGKSPQKIAPSPVSSTAQLAPKVTVMTVPAASALTTTITSTPPKLAPIAVSPSSKFIIRPPTTQAVRAKQGTVGATLAPTVNHVATPGTPTKVVVSTSAGVQPIQVPGSKFSYIRLVSAPSTVVTSAGNKSIIAPSTVTRPIAPAALASTTSTTQASGSPQVKIALPIAPVCSTQLIGQPMASRTTVSVASKQLTGQRILIPASNVGSVTQIRPTTGGITVPASALAQLPPGTTLFSPTGNLGNIVMLPAQYVTQLQAPISRSQSSGGASTATTTTTSSTPTAAGDATTRHSVQGSSSRQSSTPSASSSFGAVNERSQSHSSSKHQINGTSLEANGVRPRKPCNCTKSQCLKLYCDCFANGEFCHNCNCNNCSNNLEHEEERQKAIKSCLERNSHAFHPKIGKSRDGEVERRHNKGCNCKRSGCLKNYCECYEAKIMCSYICKCVGCKNFAESAEKKTLMHLADAAEVRVQQQTAAKSKLSSQMQDIASKPAMGASSGERLPSSFITTEVVEATCQCLLAQADEGREKNQSESLIEKLVLEECGRCLLQIIEYASKTKL